MKIFVVIVTYNGMPWLDKCLSSVPSQYTIIVVDNASTDETCNFIKAHFKGCIILEQEKNLGFGQANNLGISYAMKNQAEAVFLLNQDAYIVGNTIEMLRIAHQENREFGVLSPVHFDGSGELLDKQFSYYVGYSGCPTFYTEAYKGQLKNLYEVLFVNAAAWYIPLEVLASVGGFDPIFFHYGEDDNYIQRVQYHNYKVGIVTNSIILHDRANRKSEKLEKFSENYFNMFERRLKVKYANINKKLDLKELASLKRNARTSSLKSLLQLNLTRYKGYRRQHEELKSIIENIDKSRKKNIKIGSHYLE